jgi:hypothetical protein
MKKDEMFFRFFSIMEINSNKGEIENEPWQNDELCFENELQAESVFACVSFSHGIGT